MESYGNEKRAAINEYIDVKVSQNLEQLCRECYQGLGWTLEGTTAGLNSATLRFMRDRKIKNRGALYELQRQCEDAIIVIEKLEKNRNRKPMIVSLISGICGATLIGSAVMSTLYSIMILAVLLAILGFLGCGLGYFLYPRILKESSDKINPVIEQNIDIIYDACEKARLLLS